MNIKDDLINVLNEYTQQALGLCSELADEMDVNIYLVGGIVRDIILKRDFNDIDLLIEYDAILFAELLCKSNVCEVEIISQNEKLRTAKLLFSFDEFSIDIDLASTRSEFYEYPSALPILAETAVPLRKDIKRRDFTINALAVSLNKNNYGEIFDETNQGLEDLSNGLLRILHPDSFIDDPSRIVRGLKYRSKLTFNLEYNTELLQYECLDSGKYDNDCQERIRKEVIEVLNFNNPFCFDKFISENIYKLIISNISKKHIPGGNLFAEIIEANLEFIDKQNIWLIYIAVLFNYAPRELAIQNIEKLCLKKREKQIFDDFMRLNENIVALSQQLTNYEIYNLLKDYANEAIVACQCVLKNSDISEKIYLYFNKLTKIKLKINGNDIKKLGIESGEIFKDILNGMLKAKMNENLSDAQEKQYLKFLCEYYK